MNEQQTKAMQLARDFINELMGLTPDECGDVLCNNGDNIILALDLALGVPHETAINAE